MFQSLHQINILVTLIFLSFLLFLLALQLFIFFSFGSIFIWIYKITISKIYCFRHIMTMILNNAMFSPFTNANLWVKSVKNFSLKTNNFVSILWKYVTEKEYKFGNCLPLFHLLSLHNAIFYTIYIDQYDCI